MDYLERQRIHRAGVHPYSGEQASVPRNGDGIITLIALLRPQSSFAIAVTLIDDMAQSVSSFSKHPHVEPQEWLCGSLEYEDEDILRI